VGFLVTFWRWSLGSLDEMWRGVDFLARKEKIALQSAQIRETSIFSRTSKKSPLNSNREKFQEKI
jgi:hypothetical protein